MPRRCDAFVVCPTEYGGHIEHAYDTARGLLDQPEVASVTIVTRPGAADYLAAKPVSDLSFAEVIPPRRLPREGRKAALGRAIGQVADLGREHLSVRRVVSQAAATPLVVMEVLRYPFPRMLAPVKGSEVVSFLHNARPHFDPKKAGLRQRLLMAFQGACLQRSDRVVVHGGTQRETALTLSRTPLQEAPLPVTSYLMNYDGTLDLGLEGRAVCVGEVRANKGVELAIAAAKAADVPLTVLGKTESSELAAELRRRAAGADIVMVDSFLSREEFESAIAQSHLVVLPYTHFDAQSGILSRAIGARRRILCSDLAALRDQAGDYPFVRHADPADANAFGIAMREGLDAGPPQGADVGAATEAEWGAVARAILGCP